AVPRGGDARAEAGREPALHRGYRPLGEPADRRPAARRGEKVHLHHAAVLSREFAAEAVRPAGAGAGTWGDERRRLRRGTGTPPPAPPRAPLTRGPREG